MTSSHLTTLLRRANLMARTTDSPATKQYWLERAADLSRELGLVMGPFEVMAPVKRDLRDWVKL